MNNSRLSEKKNNSKLTGFRTSLYKKRVLVAILVLIQIMTGCVSLTSGNFDTDSSNMDFSYIEEASGYVDPSGRTGDGDNLYESTRNGLGVKLNYAEGADFNANKYSSTYNDAFYIAPDLSNDLVDISYFNLLDEYYVTYPGAGNETRTFVYVYTTRQYKDGAKRTGKVVTVSDDSPYVLYPEVNEEEKLPVISENSITVLATYSYANGEPSYHEITRVKTKDDVVINSKTSYKATNDEIASNSKDWFDGAVENMSRVDVKSEYYSFMPGDELYLFNADNVKAFTQKLGNSCYAPSVFDEKDLTRGLVRKYDFADMLNTFLQNQTTEDFDGRNFSVDVYDYNISCDKDDYTIYLDITATDVKLMQQEDGEEAPVVVDEDGNPLSDDNDNGDDDDEFDDAEDIDDDMSDVTVDGKQASYDFVGTVVHRKLPGKVKFDVLYEQNDSGHINYYFVPEDSVYIPDGYNKTGALYGKSDYFSRIGGFYSYMVQQDGRAAINLDSIYYYNIVDHDCAKMSAFKKMDPAALSCIVEAYNNDRDWKADRYGNPDAELDTSYWNDFTHIGCVNSRYTTDRSKDFGNGEYGVLTYSAEKEFRKYRPGNDKGDYTYPLCTEPNAYYNTQHSSYPINDFSASITGNLNFDVSWDDFLKNNKITGNTIDWEFAGKSYSAYSAVSPGLQLYFDEPVLDVAGFISVEAGACAIEYACDDNAIIYNKDNGNTVPFLIPLTSLSYGVSDFSMFMDIFHTVNLPGSNDTGSLLDIEAKPYGSTSLIYYIFEKKVIVVSPNTSMIAEIKKSTLNDICNNFASNEIIKNVGSNRSLSDYYQKELNKTQFYAELDLKNFCVEKEIKQSTDNDINEIIKNNTADLTEEEMEELGLSISANDYIANGVNTFISNYNNSNLSFDAKYNSGAGYSLIVNTQTFNEGATKKDIHNSNAADNHSIVYDAAGISFYDSSNTLIETLEYPDVSEVISGNKPITAIASANFITDNWDNTNNFGVVYSAKGASSLTSFKSIQDAIKEDGLYHRYIINIAPDKADNPSKYTCAIIYMKDNKYDCLSVSELINNNSSLELSKTAETELEPIVDSHSIDSIKNYINHIDITNHQPTNVKKKFGSLIVYTANMLKFFESKLTDSDAEHGYIVSVTPKYGIGLYDTTKGLDDNSRYLVPTFQRIVYKHITDIIYDYNDLYKDTSWNITDDNTTQFMTKKEERIERSIVALSNVAAYGIYENDLPDSKDEYQYLFMGYDRDDIIYSGVEMIRAKMVPFGVAFSGQNPDSKYGYYDDFKPVEGENAVYYLMPAYYDEYGKRIVDKDYDYDDITPAPSYKPYPSGSGSVTASPTGGGGATASPSGGGGDTPTASPSDGGGDKPSAAPSGGNKPTASPSDGGGDKPTAAPSGGGGTASPSGGNDKPTAAPSGGGGASPSGGNDKPTAAPSGGGGGASPSGGNDKPTAAPSDGGGGDHGGGGGGGDHGDGGGGGNGGGNGGDGNIDGDDGKILDDGRNDLFSDDDSNKNRRRRNNNDSDDDNNGISNNGISNNGISDNGISDNGVSDDGISDNTASNNGGNGLKSVPWWLLLLILLLLLIIAYIVYRKKNGLPILPEPIYLFFKNTFGGIFVAKRRDDDEQSPNDETEDTTTRRRRNTD